MTHDEVIKWMVKERNKFTKEDVTNYFLASLSSRNSIWRAAFGYYAVFLHLQEHKYEASQVFSSAGECKICRIRPEENIDTNSLADEVRESRFDRCSFPEYAAMTFLILSQDLVPEPTKRDIAIFESVLNSIRALPEDAQLAKLKTSITGLLKSNKRERDILLHILGYSGILCSRKIPSFVDRFIGYQERELAQTKHFYKRDTAYPLRHWTGKDGVNETAVEWWFGPEFKA